MRRTQPNPRRPFLARLRGTWDRLHTHWWIQVHGLRHFHSVPTPEFTTASPSLAHASPMVLSSLRSLDRLAAHLAPTAAPEDYHFLDVGCGTGIAALYAAQRHGFRSFAGIDFQKEFIEKARDNHRRLGRIAPVRFEIADAASYRLSGEPTFLFLFHPFARPVLDRFLHNNQGTLSTHRCVLAYSNPVHLEAFESLPCRIESIPRHPLALIRFG